jgi:hypothetical protein
VQKVLNLHIMQSDAKIWLVADFPAKQVFVAFFAALLSKMRD